MQVLTRCVGPSMATTKALLLPSNLPINSPMASRSMVLLHLRLMVNSSTHLLSNSNTRLLSNSMGKGKLHRCHHTTDRLRSNSSSSTSTNRAVRTVTDSMPPGLLLTFMQVPDPHLHPKDPKDSATAHRRATDSSIRRVQGAAKHFLSVSTTLVRKDSFEAASTM
jgi:hypothetical protein